MNCSEKIDMDATIVVVKSILSTMYGSHKRLGLCPTCSYLVIAAGVAEVARDNDQPFERVLTSVIDAVTQAFDREVSEVHVRFGDGAGFFYTSDDVRREMLN